MENRFGFPMRSQVFFLKKVNLESEGNGDSHYEEEKWHYEVGQGAAVPRRVVDSWICSAGIIYQYH